MPSSTHDTSGTVLDLDAARARRVTAGGQEPWVRTAGVADHFAVSERTIQRWKDKGMPCRKYGVVMFQLGRCERWLEEQAG